MSALFQLNSLREYPSLKAILYYSSQDLHTQYGLRHFLNKYNLAAADNPQYADVCIGYSAPEGLGSKTQILLSSTAKAEIRPARRLGGKRIQAVKKKII